jgi:hypothetical protein
MLDGDLPLMHCILNNKHFTLICLVHFELLAFPFVSSSITLILSYRSDSSMSYPCSCMKWRAHRISTSCLLRLAPLLRNFPCLSCVYRNSSSPFLVWSSFRPLCTLAVFVNRVHHVHPQSQVLQAIDREVRYMFKVPFRYPRSLLTFPQSSSSMASHQCH